MKKIKEKENDSKPLGEHDKVYLQMDIDKIREIMYFINIINLVLF